MNEPVTLYQLRMSSNSIKIRIALGYKGIRYERVDVDPQDRSALVKISGQPLTPVLTHGDRVLFDSASILRYLDANFRDTPSLFSADSTTMRSIERWESWARTELAAPFYILMTQFRGPEGERDPAEYVRGSRLLNELTARIEEQLGKSPWLAGEAMSAADVTAAPAVFAGMVPPELAGSDPRLKFYSDNFKLGEGRDLTRAWAAKVMAYDR